jgi:hypothetical protein
MKIEVRSPAYAVNLRIDSFSIASEVLHLWPTATSRRPVSPTPTSEGSPHPPAECRQRRGRCRSVGSARDATRRVRAIEATPRPSSIRDRSRVEGQGAPKDTARAAPRSS